MHLISLQLLSRQFNYVTISKFCTTAFCKHLVNTPCPWLLRLRLFQGNTWNFVCTLLCLTCRFSEKMKEKMAIVFFRTCKYVNLLVKKIDSSKFGKNWWIFCTQCGLHWSSTACSKAPVSRIRKMVENIIWLLKETLTNWVSLDLPCPVTVLTKKEVSFWLLELPGVLSSQVQDLFSYMRSGKEGKNYIFAV